MPQTHTEELNNATKRSWRPQKERVQGGKWVLEGDRQRICWNCHRLVTSPGLHYSASKDSVRFECSSSGVGNLQLTAIRGWRGSEAQDAHSGRYKVWRKKVSWRKLGPRKALGNRRSRHMPISWVYEVFSSWKRKYVADIEGIRFFLVI